MARIQAPVTAKTVINRINRKLDAVPDANSNWKELVQVRSDLDEGYIELWSIMDAMNGDFDVDTCDARLGRLDKRMKPLYKRYHELLKHVD